MTGSGGPKGMPFLRVSDPTLEYAMINQMTSCACSLMILLHSLGGVTRETNWYTRML